MNSVHLDWRRSDGWQPETANQFKPNLVLYFGSRELLADAARYHELRAMFPEACLMGCTTGGQIHDSEILDDEINAVALRFDAATVKAASVAVADVNDSRRYGETLGRALSSDDLSAMFVLSDGLHVNGSELVAGINSQVGNVPVTGGLAGDGPRFIETLVGVDAPPRSRNVAAIGFYGSSIRIGHGSAGGWDVFGPQRLITKSKGNVLLELDGKPALTLYERYLGEDEIKALPGSALLFPLQIHDPRRPEHQVVRTVLAVDHNDKSMTFAGDMPEGWVAKLMRGTFHRLAEGAADAAQQARDGLESCRDDDGVAILISCIGRRLLMGQRAVDEVEAVNAVLGSRLRGVGFYSYGEISPHAESGICELHNQTMTITTIGEAAA